MLLYTKGKWVQFLNPLKKQKERIVKEVNSGVYIAYLEANEIESDLEIEANANLIAASPLMYEALKAVCKALEKTSGKNNWEVEITYGKIIAALNAAEGK